MTTVALARSLQQPFQLHRNAPHPRDCVRLQESNHIYFNLKDHAKRYTSVTTFIGGFFHKFDGNAVIQKYYDNWQNNPTHKYFGMTPGEILFRWNENGRTASEKGTAHHANIENFYNETGTHDATTPEFKLFLEAMSTHASLRPLIPHRMEWIIYSERLQLAGSMDGFFQLPAGHPDGLPDRESYVILDWKFIKKYDGPVPGKRAPEWARYGRSPATRELMECHYNKYRIQLLIYAYILETEYNMPVVGLANVAFNVDGVELAGVNWGANMNRWEYLPYGRDDALVAALIAERLAQLGGRDEMDPYYMCSHLVPTCASLREWDLDAWDGVSLKELERREGGEGEGQNVSLKRPRASQDEASSADRPAKKRHIAAADAPVQ